MSDIKAVFLDSGKRLVTGALAGFSIFSIHSFKIGDSFGFEPNKEDLQPTGTVVFTGFNGLTQTKATAEDTVRYTIIVPEHAGPFMMGNMVIYGAHLDGVEIPFLSVVFPFSIQKIKSEPPVAGVITPPTPGSRFSINIDIKHSLEEIEEVTVNVVSPEYASLPFYANETQVPAPELNPWSQFIVSYDSRTKSPVLVTRDSTGVYWALPMQSNFKDPKLGIMDGGIQGDGLGPSPYDILSGHWYATPDDDYAGSIGGLTYTDSVSNEDLSLGGIPY